MVMDGVENPVESKNEVENSGVKTTRLENDGNNLPKSNSKFTSSVLAGTSPLDSFARASIN